VVVAFVPAAQRDHLAGVLAAGAHHVDDRHRGADLLAQVDGALGGVVAEHVEAVRAVERRERSGGGGGGREVRDGGAHGGSTGGEVTVGVLASPPFQPGTHQPPKGFARALVRRRAHRSVNERRTEWLLSRDPLHAAE
jgi:hypothetical protein